ncbi:hypothetical protein MUO69_06390 [Candidatus Bathyarchaeota archaeon]|jgi:hypothetical protein|nr:hypothetical protein [Candidatus Bathyarchaeota archaeon]
MNTNLVKQIAILACVSFIVALALYFSDIQLFPSSGYVKPADAAFIEGVLFVLSGLLIFIGSGGISRTSQKAALLASAAKAISDKEVIGPSEIFRRDAWRPRGYTRLGLVLILTGLFLLIICFIFS